MDPEIISGLLVKEIKGSLSPEEADALKEWRLAHPADSSMVIEWINSGEFDNDFRDYFNQRQQTLQLIREHIHPSIQTVHRIHFLKTAWFRYAAAIIIILGACAYFWILQNEKKTPVTASISTPALNDVSPGSQKALLRLANGKIIELDSSGKENIAEGALTIHNEKGKLSYERSAVAVANTMSTPRGGQYRLSLSDGTHVWLNAASSITYPTSFQGHERKVSVNGEVYFEVAKNSKQPFIVKTVKDEITVLGTSFNVNAYEDEPEIKTSLINGAIKVNGKLLHPGEAYRNGKITATQTDQDIAWLNGVFNFNDQNIDQIMRQLSRWYNIQVSYEGEIPDIQFVGKMSRKLSLSKVLEFLKGSGVKFKLENETLIISK